MEKTMVLEELSPVKVDEYTDKKTGEVRTFRFCQLTLNDGIDTIIAELPVSAEKDAAGNTIYPQPELPLGKVYGVSIEITGRTWEKDGRTGYNNRCRIRKIAKL